VHYTGAAMDEFGLAWTPKPYELWYSLIYRVLSNNTDGDCKVI